jgi:hypothetical protein
MLEEKRSHLGFVVPPDPQFSEAGKTANSKEYKDKVGKLNAAPATLNAAGTPKYANDGLTQDWWASHLKPTE